MSSPPTIEIWDWKEGKCIKTLTEFDDSVYGHALLPDGKFVGGDWSGTIRVGSLDNWAAATAIDNGRPLISVLAAKDGSFVTTDDGGNIKLWRNGKCEVTLTGANVIIYFGITLAVVGRRLVVIGASKNLLVAD